ncbi:MAG: AmmeMemoRadiSam system radical SAM enzyme, partial [Candidatus Thiodiazotropha taylori]|nr:AmmeMemoRadiSam system radical SAM enzyme [Candidatus Thiodiazotropha taylori]MCW4252305.1 AmmeMemoRadiSam system radical SAM enzyme [Candidatus Thiodiazotropha taylori]
QESSTWCHHCGSLLIQRDWYELGSWALTPVGCCQQCGTQVPGLFEAEPGVWGSRRQVVDLQRGVL